MSKSYRELCNPRANGKGAGVDFSAFMKDVERARQKHSISDVTIVAQLAAMTSDGQEGRVQYTVHLGQPALMLQMLAEAFGYEQCAHEHRMIAAVAKAREKGRA